MTKHKLGLKLKCFYKSVWFFPVVLLLCLLVLSVFRISGSSIGIYNNFLYGPNKTDSDLLFNRPNGIRSDEWIVTTQNTIAQSNDEFKPVNNLGNGSDISLLVDAPVRDPIVLFRPHNLSFLVLPLEVAFALKWWLLGYFLIVSIYFLVLTFLPSKRLFAGLISVAFTLSPFVQWWYQYITLAPLYLAVFAIIIYIRVLKAKTFRAAALWSMALAYVSISFVMVLYPPFQIPCALVALAVVVGYTLDYRKKITMSYKQLLTVLFGTLLVTCVVLVGLLYPKMSTISTIQHTSYPGQRVVLSGGLSVSHLLTSNLSPVLQSINRTKANPTLINQCEGSNFILTSLLLIPIMLFGIVKKLRAGKIFKYIYTFSAILAIVCVMIAWAIFPGLDFIGKILLLDKVPPYRLLIGFGLANILLLILFLSVFEDKKMPPKKLIVLYALAVLALYIILDLQIAHKYPGFISVKWGLLFALPFTSLVVLFGLGYSRLALVALLGFTLLSVYKIHPLYHGLSVVTETPLSISIRNIDDGSGKKWVTDYLQIENFALLNGKNSLGGTYTYPQNKLWSQLGNKDSYEKYNRYAHVNYTFDQDKSTLASPQINQPSPDQLNIYIEPCDEFFKNNSVGYLISTTRLSAENAPCAKLVKNVAYPVVTFHIYKLSF